jgi:hypothetical protein
VHGEQHKDPTVSRQLEPSGFLTLNYGYQMTGPVVLGL